MFLRLRDPLLYKNGKQYSWFLIRNHVFRPQGLIYSTPLNDMVSNSRTGKGRAVVIMRKFGLILGVLTLFALSGCAAAALTAGGIAGSAGVNHTLNGIVYKTFTKPVKDMRAATLKTLNRMKMKVKGDEKAEYGWHILATAADREIDIELERLTPSATRMRVSTSNDLIFKDSATSTEIIIQTAELLENQKTRKKSTARR